MSDGDVAGHLRVLLEPAHRVAVPVLAERDVDPQAVTVANEPVARRLADPEQHLELVLVAGQAVLGDEPQPLRDQPPVVRRDPDVDPAPSSSPRARTKFVAHLVEVAETRSAAARRRCPCRAGRSAVERRERADVPDRPAQVGLEDDADVVEARLAQLAVHAQRVGRAASPPCRSGRSCRSPPRGGTTRLEIRAAELVAELQTERGQLDADVRVELLSARSPRRRRGRRGTISSASLAAA